MKFFKKAHLSGILLLIFSIVISLLSFAGCSETFVSDGSRIDFVLRSIEEVYAKDSLKYDVNYTITAKEGGEEYSYILDFTECYDARDPEKLSFSRDERRNDLTGITQSYVYTDGYMYLSSEVQKIKAKFSDISEMSNNIAFYYMHYEYKAVVDAECPDPVNGIYTLTHTHSKSLAYDELYQSLYWAIPSGIWDNGEVTEFVETYKFNKITRDIEYIAEVKISSLSEGSTDSVDIKLVNKVSNTGFEVEVPEDAEDYQDVGNYAVLSDVIIAMNNHYSSANGSFEVDRSYDIAGVLAEKSSATERFEYKTTEGLLTFQWESAIEAVEYSNTTKTVYDGSVVITESMGSRTQGPMSQYDAYACLLYYKDPFWIDRTMANKIESVKKNGNRVIITIEPTYYFLQYVVAEELMYWELDYDEETFSADGLCEIAFLDYSDFESGKEMYIKLDYVKINLKASFVCDGVESTMDYEYNMRVKRQD